MRRHLLGLGIALAIGAMAYAASRVLPRESQATGSLTRSISNEKSPLPTRRPAPRVTSAGRLPARATATEIAAHVRSAATRHGVPESLVAAVISVESQFNSRAISRRGARGLMQLMPETAAGLGVRNAFDPRENVDAGARHLRDLLKRFENDLPLALAAYNAGPQAVIDYGGMPPYPETRAFVARVLGRLDRAVVAATFARGNSSRRVVRVAARLTRDGVQETGEAPILQVALAVPYDDREPVEPPPPPREREPRPPVVRMSVTPADRTEAP